MFITSEARVLVELQAASMRAVKTTYREMANEIGITERHFLALTKSLEKNGFVIVEREGRSNYYVVPESSCPLVRLIKSIQELVP